MPVISMIHRNICPVTSAAYILLGISNEFGGSRFFRWHYFFSPQKLKGLSVKITSSSLFGSVLPVRNFYYTFIVNKLSHCSQWIFFFNFQLTLTPYKKQVVYKWHWTFLCHNACVTTFRIRYCLILRYKGKGKGPLWVLQHCCLEAYCTLTRLSSFIHLQRRCTHEAAWETSASEGRNYT